MNLKNMYGRSWKMARSRYLSRHSCCVLCLQRGTVEPATVVDHVRPWRSGATEEERSKLFNDPANWQPVCKPCHDSAKQILEKTGHLPGCNADGMPFDPQHPWFREDE